MGLSEIPANYMPQNAGGHVVVYENPKDKMSNKRKIHLLKKIKKRFGLVRRSPSSCPGPNNLPPLQFHTVHGDNIRISRDGTLARRFESFCRAITFSARPVRINERICIKFSEISNNWNGGIRFGFTNNDPATLENSLPKYACPDLTNRPGFWAKALHEQYCEKDNILYYYVNSSGDVIYGINNEEKGIILSGIDTRGMLWTIIDIYGNCTAIEFLDARIYMYQHQQQQQQLERATTPTAAYMTHTLPGPQTASSNLSSSLNLHNAHQQSRRSLPAVTGGVEQQLERNVMPSLQSLNLSFEQQCNNTDSLPPLRYNSNGRLIPVPFHITKGRNVRLSHDRFIASRTENDFCQGYVFTARPIRLGERIIVQVLKTEHMYVGALALGLTSCNPATLQANDLPNDSDFLLDRPEYWVVSKDIAAAPQRCDEIAFFVATNGEVSISKNNGPAVVVMHVDQTLQLWAFLDVYGSTQSVRMFRQQLPNMISYPTPTTQSAVTAAASNSSSINALNSASSRLLNHHMPVSESISSLNSSACVNNNGKLHMNTLQHSSSTSSSTLASALSSTHLHNSSVTAGAATTTVTSGSRMISMPSNGDILQIQQPNGGGTVLVVNLPPANTSSSHDLSVSQSRLGGSTTTGILTGTCSNGTYAASSCSSGIGQQFIEPIVNGNNNINTINMNNNCNNNKWKDTVDHSTVTTPIATTNASCSTSNNGSSIAECTICYENQIDSVLYMCGHMCMCYDCAIEQWRGVGGGQCPLCRAVIRDVIRTYTT